MFGSSLKDELNARMLSEKKHQMEQLKLDLGPEEFERMLHSNEFRKWEGQFNAYILDVLFTRRQQAAGSCTFLAWKKIYHGLLLMIARTALATSSHSLMASADCQSQWSHLYEEKYDASYIRRVFNKTRL